MLKKSEFTHQVTSQEEDRLVYLPVVSWQEKTMNTLVRSVEAGKWTGKHIIAPVARVVVIDIMGSVLGFIAGLIVVSFRELGRRSPSAVNAEETEVNAGGNTYYFNNCHFTNTHFK